MTPTDRRAGFVSALLERFGEPIGDLPGDHDGVPDERDGAGPACCDQCGMMPTFEGDHTCPMDETVTSGEPPVCHCGGERFSKAPDGMLRCKDCGREMMVDDLDEVAPPGEEKQVRALKKQPGVRNPYAVAWSRYDKKHG